MATKATTTSKTTTKRTTSSATRKKGEMTKEEHLAEANRAMTRAWEAISRRQNKGD